ncbi:MAG: PAS domain S-box protein [Bacteroidota bacterium]
MQKDQVSQEDFTSKSKEELIKEIGSLQQKNTQLTTQKEKDKEAKEKCSAETQINLEKLTSSEVRYRRLFESAKDGILILDADSGMIVDVNPFLVNLLGYSHEAFLGKTIWDIGIFKDIIANKDHFIELQKKGYIRYEDLPLETFEGRRINVEFVSNVYLANHQKVIQCNIRDITNRKQVDEDLRQTNSLLTSIVDNIPNTIFLKDAKELRFVRFNKAGEGLIGIPREEMIGKNDYDFFLKEQADSFTKNDRDVLQNKIMKDFPEETIQTRHQGIRLLHTKKVPILDANGEPEYLLGISEDITDHKQAVNAIIENQRLSAIGEMASSVAHDFNNSLQSIFGNLELAMLSAEFSETTLKYLQTIKTVASDAAIRAQLLQRFGGNKQAPSHFLNVNLNSLITEVIAQTRPLWKDEAEKKGVKIEVNTELGEIPEMLGNDGELRTVFYNIFKNSIEAMPGGGLLTIQSEKKYEQVYLTVTDTGTGMNNETRTRVFQPFYSTKGFDIGRGLGMSGVFSIIKEHGGSISVKSTVLGKGTTFEIIFPITKRVETKEDKNIKESEEIKPVKNTLLKVLWVEDDLIIRDNVTMMMEMLGHKVDSARSGDVAIEFLNKNKYDLVITDIGMPGMSGWQLADIIKEKFGGKMKVAVVSGWGGQIDEEEKMAHGVGYVLGKPFSIQQLEKLLSDVAQFNAG